MPNSSRPQVIKPTFQIQLEVILARANHFTFEETIDELVEWLNEPLHSTCSLQQCAVQHKGRLGVCNTGGRDQWSVRMAPNVCSGEEAALAPDNVLLQTVAIHSPVFEYRKPRAIYQADHNNVGWHPFHDPWFSPEWQIERILHRLRQINNPPNRKRICAIYTNSNCTLHVLIGDVNETKPFHTRTIKTLLKFCHLFEGQFDSIHSASRIRRGEMNALAFVAKINNCTSMSSLMNLLPSLPITYSALNATALPRTGMLDFCQHVATLDFAETMAWIHTVVTMTVWAKNLDCTQTKRYLQNRWGDIGLSLPRILQDFSRFGQVEVGFAREHYSRVQDGIEGRDYAEVQYEETMRKTAEHPLRGFLQHVAAELYLDSNRNAVDLAMKQKVLAGEYGWLPKGSPLVEMFPGLPIKRHVGRENWELDWEQAMQVKEKGLSDIEVSKGVVSPEQELVEQEESPELMSAEESIDSDKSLPWSKPDAGLRAEWIKKQGSNRRDSCTECL